MMGRVEAAAGSMKNRKGGAQIVVTSSRSSREVLDEAYETEKKLQKQPRALDLLSTASREAYLNMQPSDWDRQVREELIQEIGQFASNVFPGCRLVPFGSFRMDMYCCDGDLDLSLEVPISLCPEAREAAAATALRGAYVPCTRNDKLLVLRRFCRALRQYEGESKYVRNVLFVHRATIPVVKFVHCKSGVECDISLDNRDGVFKSALLGMVGTIDNRFRQLTYLVKAWAKKNAINDAKHGTLSSLSLILLVAFHLQTRSPPILPPFSSIIHGSNAPAAGTFNSEDGSVEGLVCNPDLVTLAQCEERIRMYTSSGFGQQNTELVAELLASFFTKLSAVAKLWAEGLCASTYHGRWILKSFSKENHEAYMAVEDFLDPAQNCARAVRKKEFTEIVDVVNATLRMAIHERPQKYEALKNYLFGDTQKRLPGQRKPKGPTYRRPDQERRGGGGGPRFLADVPTPFQSKDTSTFVVPATTQIQIQIQQQQQQQQQQLLQRLTLQSAVPAMPAAILPFSAEPPTWGRMPGGSPWMKVPERRSETLMHPNLNGMGMGQWMDNQRRMPEMAMELGRQGLAIPRPFDEGFGGGYLGIQSPGSMAQPFHPGFRTKRKPDNDAWQGGWKRSRAGF